MSRKRFATSAIAAVALAGLGLAALFQQQASQAGEVVATRSGWLLNAPPGFTDQEEDEAMLALVNNDPLPIGWEVVDVHEEITASLSGLINMATGEKQLIITLKDNCSDVDYVNLYLEGTLVFAATRSNGAIVDRNGIALASIPTWIPADPPYSLRLEWADQSGHILTDTVTLLGK